MFVRPPVTLGTAFVSGGVVPEGMGLGGVGPSWVVVYKPDLAQT